MFNFLDDVPISKAIAGAYYAIRAIKHLKKIRIEGLSTEPSLEDEKLGSQIIDEILEYEGVSLSELDVQKAKEYILQLAGIIQNLVRKEFDYDEERGRKLLEEMRTTSCSGAASIVGNRTGTRLSGIL